MKLAYRAAVAVVGAGLVAGTATAEQPTTGPVAVYWMSAATSTGMGGMGGMGGGMGGQGMGRPSAPPPQAQQQKPKRPGFGAMMGMAIGGGAFGVGGGGGGEADQDAGSRGGYGGSGGSYGGGYGGRGRGMPPGMGGGGPTRSLMLQLGSTQRPTGAPEAEHLPPAALGAGPSLPLVTPRIAPPEPAEPGEPPQMTQRPKGHMLIYWGCGEHAAAPPIDIDFSRIGPGQPMPHFPYIIANPGRPPSAGRFATYGEWPNERSRTTVPPDGSLVGDHTVQGDYSPDIHFSLSPNQDFLPALNITSTQPTPAGATRVTWAPVTGATGYFAWMFGAGGGSGGDTVVMWSSGMSATMMGALTDYLPPSEVRRLIAQRMVMPPTTTECIVPSEVIKASPFGMLSMIAYGEESDFADPPRPASPKAVWNIKWTVKVRRKSTTSSILGMPGRD